MVDLVPLIVLCQLGEHLVAEHRPGVLGPLVEVAVGQSDAGRPGLRVHPQERPGPPEVAEGRRQVTIPRPVRALVGTQLEAQTPVIGALHPVAGQHAVQAGVGGLGRLGEGLRRKQGGYLQFGGEPGQIGAVDTPP